MSNLSSVGDSKISSYYAGTKAADDPTGKVQGRLGTWGRTVIILGWIIEVVILAFLLFLWNGEGTASGGQRASTFWRWIMLNQLASQSATLSAMILQNTLVAALMLEARDVRVSDVPRFSVLRAINGGPLSIAEPLASSPRKFFRSWPAFLILLLYISTLAVQFSSTILVTDFRQTSLLEYSTQRRVNALSTTPDLLESPTNATEYMAQAWEMAPTSFPPFAEQVVESPLELKGLSDTGNIKRAFLPFTTQGRQGLREYQGAAVTYKSRVACSRPTVEGSLQFKLAAGSYFPRIRGNVTWASEEAFANFSCSQGETLCTRAFDCPVPYAVNNSNLTSILSEQPTSLCLFNETDQTSGLHTTFSDIFLVLNSETNYQDWLDFNVSNQTNTLGRYDGPSFSRGLTLSSDEWVEYGFGPVAKINMTVCQNTIIMGFENITAAATVDLEEPTLNYNSFARVWETGDVLELMNIGSISNTTRGIMKISDTSAYTEADLGSMMQGSFNHDWLSTQIHYGADIFVNQFNHLVLNRIKGGVLNSEGAENYSVYFCSHCYMDGDLTDPHPLLSVIFHAILNKTGSVAPAMQSVLFLMAQNQYYSSFSGFDFGENSTMVYSKTVNIPQEWNGITAVAAIVSLNVSCVAMITWLFMRRTRYSKYGDIWHTVAQILSPDLRHLLERASRATDKQLKKSLEEAGSEDVNAGLYLLESGRVVVLRNNAPFQHMAVDRMKTGSSTKTSKPIHVDR
ncbi:hypothetical protein VM1G_08638 [Cytospora mali]|uniref:Uncharacterized protein n=1 Tax=Cytospora mali TaxID=578113 RepID=A0A194W7W7_CYTMA|nr:hypothetical protein VM1G_08638 [Valsa mali]